MAARKRRRMARRGYILLLVLACIALAFALILTLRRMHKRQDAEMVDTVSGIETIPTVGSDQPIEDPSDPISTEDPATTTTYLESVAPATTGRMSASGSMRCDTQHIFVRVANSKEVPVRVSAGVSMDDISFDVDDPDVAFVTEDGEVIGLQRGNCHVMIRYKEETLAVPVTVRELHVENGCTYVDDILVANKSYSLPPEYDPGLLPETEQAFERLCGDAAYEGLEIFSHSDYRSYDFQQKVYGSMVSGYSKEYADSVSARPGYSEHQTGYTIDCNSCDNTFAETDEGKWLAENCWRYGFIIRYPLGKEAITGYDYESWHIRWVGKDAAKEMYDLGLTLEEYLDIDSYYHDDVEETSPADEDDAEDADEATQPLTAPDWDDVEE